MEYSFSLGCDDVYVDKAISNDFVNLKIHRINFSIIVLFTLNRCIFINLQHHVPTRPLQTLGKKPTQALHSLFLQPSFANLCATSLPERRTCLDQRVLKLT
jgi:hypothetical protein